LGYRRKTVKKIVPQVSIPAFGWRTRKYQNPLALYLKLGDKRAAVLWHRRTGKDEVGILTCKQISCFQKPKIGTEFMNRSLSVLLVLAIVLVSYSSVIASTMYMTYTSIVVSEYISSGYDYGIKVNDVLTHTYLIDKNKEGYYTRNGNTIVMRDSYFSNGTLYSDYFYSELISGVLLLNPLYPQWEPVVDDKYSSDYFDQQGNYKKTMSWAGSDWGSHLINSNDKNERGALIYHYLRDNKIFEDMIFFNSIKFEITSSPPSPVPEPSTIFLLGTGLLGLAVGAIRKIKKD
jgi:hypothetical protein